MPPPTAPPVQRMASGPVQATAAAPGFPGPTASVLCLAGVVNLFHFVAPPAPGTVIGTLNLPGVGAVPLVQTVPGLGPALAAAAGRLALVCGPLTVVGGQLALDVRLVTPLGFI